MLLTDYRPQSCLVTKVTEMIKPRFPVVDFHNHLGDQFGVRWIHRPLADLLAVLDEAGVRFCVFGGVNCSAWGERGDRFGEWAAGRLRAQKERGAAGIKVWKDFGWHLPDDEKVYFRNADHILAG